MQPETFRPVITKILRDVKFKDPDGLAGLIIRKMVAYQDLIGDSVIVSAEPTGSSYQEPASIISQDLTMPTASPVIEPVDIYKRVSAVQKQLSDDQVIEAKQKLVEKYTSILPRVITHQPPGFKAPLLLTRQGISGSQGATPFIRILYTPPGKTEVPIEIRLSIYEDALSGESVEREITKQCDALYRAQPTVAPAPMLIPLPLDNQQAWGVGNADSPDRMINSANDINPELVAIMRRESESGIQQASFRNQPGYNRKDPN